MLSTERDDFDKLLAQLFAALDKPLHDAKREGFWKALSQMGLAEFSRAIDLLLQELAEDADKARVWHDRLTPSDVWSARRRLRARGAASSGQVGPAEKPWAGDIWDIQANRLLLGYINDQARAAVHYCCEETRSGRRRASEPSQESRDLTQVLVDYKNAWARDMREMAEHPGGVPKPTQLQSFMECMRRATIEVDAVRAYYAQQRMADAA
jgi:hypothetical protein